MKYITQAGRDLLKEGRVKAKNKAEKREEVMKLGRTDTKPPSYRASISTRKAARHGQESGAASVVSGREMRK